jgi:DNA-binding transcriptional LysR family regulator
VELRHLRYFVAVAETLHFGRAAVRLHIAQPPLSRQIRQLEAELGLRLFERTQRRVQLTNAGQVFLVEARRILAQVDGAVSAARQAARGETGALAVGFIGAASYSILPPVVQAFRARYSRVELTLHEMSTEQQFAALREGRIEVGFVRPPVDDAQLAAETVLREPLLVALPRAHPLARRRALALAALAHELFVLFPRPLAPGLYDQIMVLCREAGFRPAVTQEALQMQTIARLVRAGVGVSLVPASVRNLRERGVIFRPLQDATADVEMAVAWRREDASALVQHFLAVAREATARPGAPSPSPGPSPSARERGEGRRD